MGLITVLMLGLDANVLMLDLITVMMLSLVAAVLVLSLVAAVLVLSLAIGEGEPVVTKLLHVLRYADSFLFV